MYISSLVYSDDSRVVVTMDEQLPTIEISDSPATSSIGSDFVWLAKVRANIKCSLLLSTTAFISYHYRSYNEHGVLYVSAIWPTAFIAS